MARTALPNRQAGRVRVVTFVDFLSCFGGAEHLALLIATRLDPDRFESILCVSRWPLTGPWKDDPSAQQALEILEASPARFLALARRRKVDIPALARLERFLRRERVDVLHTHKFGSNVWGTLVGSIARVPVMLAHEHTWSYEGQPLRRFLDRELISRAATRFIAVSREDERRMSEVEGIDPSRTLFIPNGVVSSPPPSGRDVRAELGIPVASPVLGAVGVLRAQKALHVLLRAIPQVRERWPDVRVLIVGDGPERAPWQQLAKELGIEDAVIFLGHRGDVPDVLRALDVAVSCSDFEGSPLAVMEYMDAALPVAATSVGGVPDLIESGVHGLLVARGDSSALASAIVELLADPARSREMGARARERRRTEFDIDTLVHRLEDLYLELLAQRRRELS
ncbi:MAG TPA: glycosyltransferase [Solirubrobacteraceae bacterium]|jgi:glycosyltransferase involved in cell wall biosynthesis|nr:glycosyltransferase [Solirubrobacteraceae bacterium]